MVNQLRKVDRQVKDEHHLQCSRDSYGNDDIRMNYTDDSLVIVTSKSPSSVPSFREVPTSYQVFSLLETVIGYC